MNPLCRAVPSPSRGEDGPAVHLTHRRQGTPPDTTPTIHFPATKEAAMPGILYDHAEYDPPVGTAPMPWTRKFLFHSRALNEAGKTLPAAPSRRS